MRLSRSLFSTLRDRPSGAHPPGQAALLRAGMIQELAPATHAFGPLALRVLGRVEGFLRAELASLSPGEVSAPLLLPAGEVHDGISTDPIELRDRRGTALRLDRTASPALLAYLDGQVDSYRQLPTRALSVGRRPRDPGAGARTRIGALESAVLEVLCADLDEGAALETRRALGAAVRATAATCGLGVVGAEDLEGIERFLAPTTAGETVVAVSSDRSYAATRACARADLTPSPADERIPMRRVETPGARSIEQLRRYLPDVPPPRMLKTMLYRTDAGDVVAALVRGDREIDAGKLRRHLDAEEIALADPLTITQVTGAEPGFAGPVGLPEQVRVVADLSVADLTGFACGANETDVHLADVWFERDLPLPEVADIDAIRPGDPAPGGGEIELLAAIDVGAVSPRGPLGVEHVTERGELQRAHISTLSVDLTRFLLALAEQHVSERGLRWPLPVAPYPVEVIQVRGDDPDQADLATALVAELAAIDIDVLWDDRDARAGVKFNDAELVGIPIRVVVGRGAAEGRVEVRWPDDDREGAVVHAAEVAPRISERVSRGS
jgi:prolyl-tRNA synthetase